MRFRTKVVSIENGIIEVESTIDERHAIIDKSYGEYCSNRACIVQIRDVYLGLYYSEVKVFVNEERIILKSLTDYEKVFNLKLGDEIVLVI